MRDAVFPKALTPTGMERLSRAIAIDSQRNSGWTLVSVVGGSSAEARFRHPTHGVLVVRFAHVDEELEVPHLRTPAFRIVPDNSSEASRELVTRIGRRLVRADETWWSVRDERKERRGRDAELIALRAGIRDGIRATILEADVEAARARYVAEGMHVVHGLPSRVDDPRPHTTLCIGRTPSDAAAVARACEKLDDEELGRLLGYPSCCVNAFIERYPSGVPGFEFYGARAARTPTPAVRLNNLLFGERARYISFEPCSYSCANALSIANAIAAAIAAIDARAVELVDEKLASHIAIRADGARARVTVAGERVAAAIPVLRAPNLPLGPEDTQFAEALVGCAIDPDGLSSSREQEFVVLRFAHGAR